MELKGIIMNEYDNAPRPVRRDYDPFEVDRPKTDAEREIQEKAAKIKKSLLEAQSKREHGAYESLRVTSELKALVLKLQPDIENAVLSHAQVLDLIHATDTKNVNDYILDKFAFF